MKSRSVTVIHQSGEIHISRDEATVLRNMFQGYTRIGLEAEFGMGFSGCRVFRVRPVEASGVAHTPALVKIGPVGLITGEWQAYNTRLKNTLPGIAWVTSEPIILSGSSRGGLRYELIGGGIFEIQSLSQYYRQASTENLLWVLQKRLFPAMSRSWWLVNRADRTFQYRSDYDQLLPVNLLVTATEERPDSEPQLISPEQLSPTGATIGSHVRLEGFVIVEMEAEQRQLTLNLPGSQEDGTADSLRLRINRVPSFDRYQVGEVIEPLQGIVSATRHSLLEEQVKKVLPDDIDLSQALVKLPGGLETNNPLLAYEDLLNSFFEVNVSTIHGDFNLENILIDPDTRDVKVIDFATVRQGHNLHDLLRLETEVVSKLVPEALNSAALPPETIQPFYEQLNQAAFGSEAAKGTRLPHQDLQKPFAILQAIRQEARKCFFNPDDPTEYYRGLIIYLLGALKFKNLDALPNAKLVAFLGAGTILDQLSTTAGVDRAKIAPPYPRPAAEQIKSRRDVSRRLPRPLLGLAVVLLVILIGLIIYRIINGGQIPVDHLYEIEKSLVTEIVDGPAADDDLLAYFARANPELMAHIEDMERTYLAGQVDQGITYIWGSPGVGKSFITRNRLNEGFPGDSCLVRLGDVFGADSEALSFEVVKKADLTTLDGGLAFDSLPAVAQANEFELDSLLEVASCRQDDGLVPLIVFDDIDEIHSETSNLILKSLDGFVLKAAASNEAFLQVIVVGRAEGFTPWYQDSKRNDDGSITDFLSVFRLNGPELMTTGDIEILADNQFAFVNGAETWERMNQDGEAAGLIDDYIRYVERHPILTYSIRTLAIATMITDRSRSGVDDSEAELKEFLFNELLRRASNSHNRPSSDDEQYRRLLEDIAVVYASEEKVNEQSFFTVGFNDTVPVMDDGRPVGEVRVQDVLDHSGIATLDPASFSTARYRFDPVWIHAHLVDRHNQR